MAQLAVAIAVNVAIAIALNALFPPPDIEQTGPRLTDLDFTGASFGKFINITFGTDRVGGTLIDCQDPAIEEVVHEESSGGGLFKGGGPSINTTTYEYFLTTRLAVGIEGASDLIQLFGDGKLIYDRTGTGQTVVSGANITFYPGGADQVIDPEEESRRGSDIPAYGHLTTIKIDQLPLANFGNRIPNFTAVISYNTVGASAFENIDTVPSGFNPPGSTGENEYQFYDTERDLVIGLVNSQGYTMRGSSMTFDTLLSLGGGNSNDNGYTDGYAFGSRGTSNNSPLDVYDVESAALLATLGTGDISPLSDSIAETAFGSVGSWHGLKCVLPTMGLVRHAIVHGNGFGGTAGNGSWVDLEAMLDGSAFDVAVLTNFGDSIFPANNPMGQGSVTAGGMWIPDPNRLSDTSELPCFGIMYWFGPDNDNSRYVLVRFDPNFELAINPITQAIDVKQNEPTRTLVRTFTWAGGDFPEGSGEPEGWAVNLTNGNLMLSNDSSIVLYDPIDDVILATSTLNNFRGRNNYYSGSEFAFVTGSSISGVARVLDTRTLENTVTLDLFDVNWTPDNPGVADESAVWDDRAQAIYLSRQDGTSGATGTNNIAKLYPNRLSTVGVGLDFVNQALATSYQRYKMAGLEPTDVDVTDLASDSLEGYTINRDSTVKNAIQPLRNRYQYDVYQSDWIIKFEKRGKTPSVTIPEEFVGELRRGRSKNDEPPVVEIRQDDLELPMRMQVRYKNKDIDYDIDVESDKRWVDTNPTMKSQDERTLDIPIVDTPQNMKRVAQQWLWTIWNERVQYKTVLPWTYIALDPSDVFNMGVFGETAQIRMAEMDIGLNYALGVTGIVEDTKSFSSTLAGGTNLGFLPKAIGSSLPSRAFFLDAPLLSSADITIASISAAYVAFGAFEDGWPGASIFRSTDLNAWEARTAGNVEAATAKVVTLPGTWGYVDNGTVGEAVGDFRNRFQEVSEGGTMSINPLRRESVWGSATEEEVLNGANTFAVITSSGVEVIQYVDATVNDNGSITLERLLRGRLGTEDIADADNMALSDEIVVLADQDGAQQISSISKQNLLTSELNVSAFYKAVTTGGLLEDAATRSFTYTGRDIMPYSVTHAEAVDDGSGGKDITWERRARGPLSAEWVDGTGEVPLNEASEEYIARLYDDAHVLSLTKADLTSKTVNFSSSELFAANPPATVEIAQVSATGFESPITPASTVQVSEPGIGLLVNTSNFNTGGAVTTYGLALPAASYQVGDIVIAGLFMSRAANGSPGTITSDGGDFISIGERNQDTILIPMGINTSLWYRVLTQADVDAGTPTFDWSWSNATYPGIGYMVFRFVDVGGTPVETATTAGSNNSTTVNLAGIIASVPKTFGIYGLAVRATASSGLNSAFPLQQSPSGFVTAETMWDNDQGAGVRYRFYLGYKVFDAAGATGTQTLQVDNAMATSPIASVWTLMNPE